MDSLAWPISFLFSSATVANLQGKVESLTTTNALMKEDLAIAKKTILSLTEENAQLKSNKKIDTISEKADEVPNFFYLKK